jgi:DNA mismatch endonuclease (patch repair protein)
LPGKPDIVFPRLGAVIFIHGCFWHGHDCALFRWPKTRPEFWRSKIGRNQANDVRVADSLLAAGWRVGVVWECAIRGRDRDVEGLICRLSEWLRSGDMFHEERSPIPVHS